MIDIQFESLTETPKTVLTEIQDFLGLRTQPLDSSLTLQNPGRFGRWLQTSMRSLTR